MADVSFLDEVRKASANKGPSCTLSILFAELPDDLRAQVVEALADPAITGEAIAVALRNRGYQMSGSTVQRHRRKACSCE